MANQQKKISSSQAPTTKQDVENAIDELAQATEKGFQHIQKRMATKEDLKQFATKEDLKQFATKDDLTRVEGKVDRLEQKVDRLERGVKALLDSSKENTLLLKEMRTLPARVTRLERTVFR